MAARWWPLTLAVVGGVLMTSSAFVIVDAWPESTSVSGDCQRDVACPPVTIETGSTALVVVGFAVALAASVALLVAVRLWRQVSSSRS